MGEPATTRQARCRSCNAPIVWGLTPEGKRVPLDARPEIAYELASEPASTMDAAPLIAHKVRRNHFTTCPDGNRWRRK